MSKTSVDNKNLGGRPRTGIGQMIGVRLQPADLAELDAWIAAQSDQLSRPEAIRRLMKAGLDS